MKQGICVLGLCFWLIGCTELPCARESCDIREESCQRTMLEVAHCVRGTEGDRLVPVRVVDADEHIDEQAAPDDAGVTDRAQEAYLRGLSMLDLGAVTERGSATRARLERVAAFYSSEERAITILDRGYVLDGIAANLLLVHEMVHALQDQEHGLKALHQSAQTVDEALAISALIEGEATLYTDFASGHAHGFSASELDLERAFARYRRDSQSELARDDNPILRLHSHFTYAFGGAFVHRAWRKGRHDPIAELFRDPPETQRELMYGPNVEPIEGVRWFETELAERAVPVLDEGLVHAISEQFGAFGVMAIYQRAAPDSADPLFGARSDHALEAARGVEADVLTVLYDEASTVITWRIRFESETDAERLRSQLAQGRYVRDDTDRDLRRRVIREQREVIVAAGSPRDLLPTDLAQLAWTRAPGSMPELGMQDESPIALGIECELPPD